MLDHSFFIVCKFYSLNFVSFRMEFNSTAFHHVYPACTRRDSNCVSACSQHVVVVVVDDSDACETCSRRRSRGETCNPTRERTSLEGGPERVQVSQGPCVTLYPCPYPIIRSNEANARFAVQRPENELPFVVEVIEEILESPRLEWPLFVSGATIRVRRAEQRFLTNVAYEWNSTRAYGSDKEDRKRENGTAG